MVEPITSRHLPTSPRYDIVEPNRFNTRRPRKSKAEQEAAAEGGESEPTDAGEEGDSQPTDGSEGGEGGEGGKVREPGLARFRQDEVGTQANPNPRPDPHPNSSPTPTPSPNPNPNPNPGQIGNVSVAYWKDMIRARLHNNTFYLSDQVRARARARVWVRVGVGVGVGVRVRA